MRLSRKLCYFAMLVSFSIPCFAHHMAVVVNKDNNVTDITSVHLARVFRLETRKWADGKDIVLVLRKDSTGEAATLEHLTGMSHAQMQSFVDTHKDSLVLVDSDSEVLRTVEATPGAIGLIGVSSINDQVRVVKVGGKLPMEQGYLPH